MLILKVCYRHKTFKISEAQWVEVSGQCLPGMYAVLNLIPDTKKEWGGRKRRRKNGKGGGRIRAYAGKYKQAQVDHNFELIK